MLHSLRIMVALGLLTLLSACTSNTVIPGTSCNGNCVNGQGTLSYGKATETGAFTMGQRTGRFETHFADGRTMTADMLNGVTHGTAIIRRADGTQFEQRYAFGVPVEGTSIRDNGDRYDGSFVTDARHATTWAWKTRVNAAGAVDYVWVHPVSDTSHFDKGTYTTADGSRYKGQFSLVGDRIVFKGETTNARGKTQNGLMSSPIPEYPGPLVLTDLTPKALAELTSLQARLAAEVVATYADIVGNITPDVAAANRKNVPVAAVAAAATLATAKAVVPVATAAVAAKPTFNVIEGNTGLFLSPITSDGVAAAWVDKSVNASLGSSIGSAAGAYAGQRALSAVPFVGGFLGSKVGASTGRQVAINAAGGEAYMRETSDISFNNINDMARWLVHNHATHPKFAEIMKAATTIYPELGVALAGAR